MNTNFNKLPNCGIVSLCHIIITDISTSNEEADNPYAEVETREDGPSHVEEKVDTVVEKKVDTPPKLRTATTQGSNESETQTVDHNHPNKSNENLYGNVSDQELLSKPIKVSQLAQCIQKMRDEEQFHGEFEVKIWSD